MNEREGHGLGFLRPEVFEHREKPQTNRISDVLQGVANDIHARMRELWPDNEEDGRHLGELFRQEVLLLLNPETETVYINGTQSLYIRHALFNAWSFKGYPSKSLPTRDESEVLGVVTYLNSLAQANRR